MECVQAEKKNWLKCHSCGELQSIVALSAKYELACCNCEEVIHVGHGKWLQAASALAVTALILYFVSIFAPFMTLEIGPQSQTMTVMDGFWALMERKQWLLSGVFITTLFVFPLFEIFAFLYLLIPYSFNKHLPGQRSVLRWLVLAQSWSMLEVFMLSVLVGSIKMADMAYLTMDIDFYTFFVLVGVLILAFIKLDRRKLWSWINANNYFTTFDDEEVYDCRICQAMVGESIIYESHECPRCRSEIHKRIPYSLQKTWALVISAAVLYIPANILPIMTYTSLGVVETDTIFSGVVELIAAGLWGIAIIVFVASIFVPIAKLLVLTYLLWSVHARLTINVKFRATLFRLTEIVGRWSMVDVFVVTIFVAIVQFGFVYTVEPEGAIIAFGAVVVLTMIAAETFDPRLLWDALDEQKREAEQALEHAEHPNEQEHLQSDTRSKS